MIEFLYTALTIIDSGGVLILMIETFRDWLFKRREEYMELAKHKINTISKNIPYYIHLARNAWNLGWESTATGEQDSKRLLYYISNMLYYKDKISEMIGDLQLASRCGEDSKRTLARYWT